MITHQIEDMTVHYLPADASAEDIAAYRAWLAGPRRAVGMDVETGGPDPVDAFNPEFVVRLSAFASETEAWVLHADLRDEVIAGVSLPVPYVIHNAPFDTKASRRHFGHAPRATLCTYLASLVVFPPASPVEAWEGDEDDADTPRQADERYALKPLSAQTGSTALRDADRELHEWFQTLKSCPKGGDDSDAVKAWEGWCYANAPVDDPRYWVYNGLDAIFCLRVLRWLTKQWRGGRADFHALLVNESRLDTMLTGITWRGLRVARTALGEVFTVSGAAQRALAPEFARFDVNNPASPPQLQAAFEALGAVNPILTDAGMISTDKKTGLPKLMEPEQPEQVRALATLLHDWRGHRALRIKTREIDAYLQKSGDGRLHPQVNALRARTTRMSISKPALQNLPKKDQRIKSAFLAEDGYVLVSADFSQVQYRVAGALSRDAAMMRAFHDGKDFHDFTAASLFGADFTGDQRSIAKTGGFAALFCAGPKRVALSLGCSIEYATGMLNSFFDTYPDLRRYIDDVAREPEIVTLSGRRVAIDPDKTYANANKYIQNGERDLFGDALLWLLDNGWGDFLWLVIHDEIILQVPEERAADAAKALETAMNMTFRGVPITAEAEVLGTRWGALPDQPAQNPTVIEEQRTAA